MLLCQEQRAAIGTGQELRFARPAASPDRPDGVDDVARGQPTRPRDPRLTGWTTTKAAALGEEAGTRRPMDGTIYAATAEQAGVGGVHDRVRGDAHDIPLDEPQGRTTNQQCVHLTPLAIGP